MSDNQESGSVIDAVQRMYGSDSEPLAPTDEVAKKDESVETEQVETEEAETEEAAESQATGADESEEEAELVFDEPNDYVKFSHDDETGLYEFKSNGKTVKANIEKLISNFNESQKFTQTQMKLSEKAKEIETVKSSYDSKVKELEATAKKVERFSQLTDQLESAIKETEEQINWDELREYDQAEYLKQKDLKEKREKLLADAKQAQTKEMEAERQAIVQREGAKLLEIFPDWKDQKVAEEGYQLVLKGAKAVGLSPEEVAQTLDHRVYNGLVKIAKYEELLEKAKEPKLKPVPKSIKSKQKSAPSKNPSTIEERWYGTN